MSAICLFFCTICTRSISEPIPSAPSRDNSVSPSTAYKDHTCKIHVDTYCMHVTVKLHVCTCTRNVHVHVCIIAKYIV